MRQTINSREAETQNHFGLQAGIHPISIAHRWTHPPRVDATSDFFLIVVY